MDAAPGTAEGGIEMEKECWNCKHLDDDTGFCDECLAVEPPIKWEPGENYIPDTNADFIRALNDRDLRNFLCGLMKCEGCSFGTSSGCKLEEWLQQPAEEG